MARAETGHPKGAAFVEVLAVLKDAVDRGQARFPLSRSPLPRDRKAAGSEEAHGAGHHDGAARRHAPYRATSRHRAVGDPTRLVQVFGLPLSVPDLEIFGHGVSHAVGVRRSAHVSGLTSVDEFAALNVAVCH